MYVVYSADGPRNGPVKSVKIQASSVVKVSQKLVKKWNHVTNISSHYGMANDKKYLWPLIYGFDLLTFPLPHTSHQVVLIPWPVNEIQMLQ